MANELLTLDDIIRGKKNFDAQNAYMTGTADEQVTLPDGNKIKTRAGLEKQFLEAHKGTGAAYNVDLGVGSLVLNKTFGLGNTGWGSNTGQDITNRKISDLFLSGVYTFNSILSTEKPVDWPTSAGGSVLVIPFSENESIQILAAEDTTNSGSLFFIRNLKKGDAEHQDKWSSLYHSTNKKPYTTTTATSANTVITSTGELQRSTSSKIFKKDIADIAIDDYRAALKAVRPVSYRSTEATADRTDWSWYSFIAEELAEIDLRLVQMDNVEFFEDTDEDGNPFINSRELPEGEYAANGINTNGLVALMAYISQQLLDDVEKLESEKTQLKRRMTSLEKRMDALDGQSADNPV